MSGKRGSLPPRYEPKRGEGPTYARWLAANAFHAPVDSPKEPFCIVIPPPNVTGSLHLGHALDNTLQDILIRFARMRGKNACWVPGTDHAGIGTQVVVERELKKEGKTRHDLGREEFVKRIWQWKEKSGNRIVEQLKLMGCSCDWERQRFTMDEGLSRAVLEHFMRLYEDGLLYRGERIVNWCPRCRTALSDLEVKRKERAGQLWHIRYSLKGGGEIVLATTRPETLLGDTAVAVNPDDERYRALVGKTAVLPLVGREIPVIADPYVDRAFGTGIVKITPGHDPNDFEIGLRHKLPVVSVMNLDATINEAGGVYSGLDRYKARQKIEQDLEAQGLLLKREPHRSAVGHCDRCDTELEPLVSLQWFVKTKPLAQEAIKAVKSGAIKLAPESAHAIFFEWMNNIKDWCVSRQLWWGHRIPAWYCRACKETIVARQAPKACPKCNGPVEQDPDVLDTWFSSALWPFSTLGWPDKTPELAKFYPTSVLITGWDILFLWVARMIMAGLKLTKNPERQRVEDRIPFQQVVIHSLVTDPEGKKMSKSKGNVVDPLELFDRFGTDAVRFTLTSLESLRQSFRLSEQKVEYSRNFMNKIWNAARFVLPELEGFSPSSRPPAEPAEADRWILRQLNTLIKNCELALESFQFNYYADLLLRFFWHDFCDIYIELAKPALKDKVRRPAAQWTLHRVLDNALRLMHPVVPFITEEIWSRLPDSDDKLLMLAAWPGQDLEFKAGGTAGAIVDLTMPIIEAIRTLKHEQGMRTDERARIFIKADASLAPQWKRIVETGYLETLARAEVETLRDERPPGKSVSIVIPHFTVYLALEKPTDPAAEHIRLSKEKETIEALLVKVRQSLENKDYLAKAPPERVDESRAKAKEYETRINRLAERIAQLGDD